MQKKGQLEEAIRAFEEAMRLGMTEFPRAHLYRANSNLDLKKYDTAIAQYTKFIEEFGLEKYQTEKEQVLELDLRENRFVKSKEAAFKDLNRSTFFHRTRT